MRNGLATGALMLFALAASLAANVSREPQAPEAGRAGTASKDQTRPSATASRGASNRKIPCKTPENASLCYWTHGRLRTYNGNPSDRIWKIGSHRILGVFNGPSHFPPRTIADDENPELPANLQRAFDIDYRHWKDSTSDIDYEFPDIFADFEVCPLEPEKQGWMQAVCIESAKNIFVQKAY
jgi:hypothetical protein